LGELVKGYHTTISRGFGKIGLDSMYHYVLQAFEPLQNLRYLQHMKVFKSLKIVAISSDKVISQVR